MNLDLADFYAVVVAGGSGSRFDTARPKQFAPLAGRPIVHHSVDSFRTLASLRAVALVLPAEGFEESVRLVRAEGLDEEVILVPGGASRQESSRNGFEAVRRAGAAGTSLVAVHDAARPLISTAVIARVVQAASEHGAAIPTLDLVDTLKCVDANLKIVSTVDRRAFVRAQTPQCFRADWLEEAHRSAIEAGFQGTDEASLVERLGKAIQCVAGEEANLKITHARDLALAAWWIGHLKETQTS